MANPTALLLSSVMMLKHLKMNEPAEKIHKSILKTIADGKWRTFDLGGSTSFECSSALLVQITDDSYPPLPVERDKRDCLNFQ
jgi:isocitrate/isopropylmalate dehydrogenase